MGESAFWSQAALAHSLRRLGDPRIRSTVAFNNTRGLPDVYNDVLESCTEEVIVFMHDDVWIDDSFFVERIFSGLSQFNVIGLAGSRKRREGQMAWSFVSDPAVRDDEFLSGRISQGENPCGRIFYFGPVPAACELLDGVLLAARRQTLIDSALRFDPQFPFHYYDMDFCRAAGAKGLRLGTWPISVTHQSRGGFLSDEWRAASAKYFEKWGS
jgi:GT2 family glycosyltransferase